MGRPDSRQPRETTVNKMWNPFLHTTNKLIHRVTTWSRQWTLWKLFQNILTTIASAGGYHRSRDNHGWQSSSINDLWFLGVYLFVCLCENWFLSDTNSLWWVVYDRSRQIIQGVRSDGLFTPGLDYKDKVSCPPLSPGLSYLLWITDILTFNDRPHGSEIHVYCTFRSIELTCIYPHPLICF